tara:strand:+ start:915 stop:1790 length:876 start_codon:yes stop_codon:yes gene_type:complete
MKFEYESIVIGSNLRALLFAFYNKLPVLFTAVQKPHDFEFLDPSCDTSFLNLDNALKSHESFSKNFDFGEKQVLLWERLYFLLSMEGLIPLSNLCDTIRYTGDSLVCSSEYDKLCEIIFDKCYYFGDNRTYKLITARKKQNARYKVFDRIGFNTGGKHHIDYMESSDDFVSKVWFYSSDRICGNTGVKDACALSILTDEQLNSSSFTQTMTNFKLLDLLKKNGLKGRVYGYNKHGESLHRSFKTHTIRRDKVLIDTPEWDETTNVKKINLSTSELIKLASKSDLSNYSYLL